MNPVPKLQVFLDDRNVGTLALAVDQRIAFAYDSRWLSEGFSISPFSLPLENRVFLPKRFDPFDGLFGVFADSLPDGWGRLLADRMLQKYGIKPEEVDSLTRLSIVGNSGMGALRYEPTEHLGSYEMDLPLDVLSEECSKMLKSGNSEHLDQLFLQGGSSGGARPKVNCKIQGEDWIVKFPSSYDPKDIGLQEYQYSLCAKRCGLDMPETRLLPSDLCSGFFAVKRFDRCGSKRIHMVSAGALLETSHRIPNLDYTILMQLTMQLTRSFEEIQKLFRLMCFNVFAHNRDDHSKNFSYLCREGKWQLSPAYDLTYSNSIGGEHATTVNGNGRDPGMEDLLTVARKAGLNRQIAVPIAQEIQQFVHEDLSGYLNG